jgi:hypothetical protein
MSQGISGCIKRAAACLVPLLRSSFLTPPPPVPTTQTPSLPKTLPRDRITSWRMDYPSILHLPDELLVEIMSHVKSQSHPRQLSSVSLTCRRFRPIAQEILLLSPSLHFDHVPKLLRTYLAYPRFAKFAFSVEITTAWIDGQGRIFAPMDDDVANVRQPKDDHLKQHGSESNNVHTTNKITATTNKVQEQCLQFISDHDMEVDAKQIWVSDFLHGGERRKQAFLAILLVMLPRLDTLLLGRSTTDAFPMLQISKPPTPKYMTKTLGTLEKRLVHLELPLVWRCKMDTMTRSLHEFQHLRMLTVPFVALFFFETTQSTRSSYLVGLPKTLEHIKIVNVDDSYDIKGCMVDFLDPTRKMPSLHRIDVYLGRNLYLMDDKKTHGACKRDPTMGIQMHIWQPTKLFQLEYNGGKLCQYDRIEFSEIEMIDWE